MEKQQDEKVLGLHVTIVCLSLSVRRIKLHLISIVTLDLPVLAATSNRSE